MADRPLHARIAELALAYVSDPPSADDAVVDFATPDELREHFRGSVGLDLNSGEAHDDDAVVNAVEQVIKYSVHTGHPRFMNQNFAGPDRVAVVGDLLGAALNTSGSTYEIAPVFTLMERAVLHRLAAFIGYPPLDQDDPVFPGLFCAGGSLANLLGLQLARHGWDPDTVRTGTGNRSLALFVSTSGHYSAKKSAALLGLGTEAVFEIEADADGAMIPEALAAGVLGARATGATPFAVVATAGTTVTGAFDPIDAIADICEEHELWLHVDACYGGSAMFSGAQRYRLDGIERSNSVAWDLHKMMGMTQQCTVLVVRDAHQLDACFAVGADYIFQPDKEFAAYDTGDRTFMCGRRIDVLKLWLAWKSQGDAGFAARVDHACALADHARRRISVGDGGLVAAVEGGFTNVCFLWVPPELRPFQPDVWDEATRSRLHGLAPTIKRRMQHEGTAMLGYQPVNGINVFRLILMNPAVSVADVDTVLELVERYGREEWSGS